MSFQILIDLNPQFRAHYRISRKAVKHIPSLLLENQPPDSFHRIFIALLLPFFQFPFERLVMNVTAQGARWRIGNKTRGSEPVAGPDVHSC